MSLVPNDHGVVNAPQEGARGAEGALVAAPREPSGRPPALLYLVSNARTGKRIIPVDSIHWIESAGNYARVYSAEGRMLVRASMAHLEADLAGQGFLRVHRKELVPLREIRELVTRSSRSAYIELRSGYKVQVSRAFQRWLLNRDRADSGSD